MGRKPGRDGKRSKAARKSSSSGLTRRQILGRLAKIGGGLATISTITGWNLRDLLSNLMPGPRVYTREFHGDATPSGEVTFRHIKAGDQVAVNLEEARGQVVVVASATGSNANATGSHLNSCSFSCDTHIRPPDYLEPAS